MSYTELTFFGKDKNPSHTEDIKNAWRGAMAIWDIMDERYLPPFIPDFVGRLEINNPSKRYFRMSSSLEEERKKVWALFNDEKVSRIDKIIIGSTFDWVIVIKQNVSELIQAFRLFEGETSLKEQADLIEEEFKDENIIAVGWNQTSVSQNNWTDFSYDQEKQESIPYNLSENDKHWNLFEEL